MMVRKTLNEVYLEKYGKTWGLNDIEKCTFEYKEVVTSDLVKLLESLTTNRDWIFAGNHHLNKMNQIVYAIRNELYQRQYEQTDAPTVIEERPRVRSFIRREDYNNHPRPERRDTEVNYNK